MKTDILIVGGGISGLLSAHELANAGASVQLLDQAELGRESSWAGGGILSPLYPWRYADSVTILARWSQQCYPTFLEKLHRETGIDPEYQKSGLLIKAENQSDIQQALRWAKHWQQPLELIDDKTCQKLEPARHPPLTKALWLPNVAQVRNPRLVKGLITKLKQQNVHLHPNTKAVQLAIDAHGQVHGVHSNHGLLEAKYTVICAGAWSANLFPNASLRPDIHPVRGQMILFRTPPGSIYRMVLEDNRYIIPRKDGRVLFGSTLETTGFDKSTTEQAYEELAQLARRRFPILQTSPIEHHWAGLRPGSPKGIPYIGTHPQLANLFINAGHFRNGVVLAPACARLLADLVMRRSSIVDPAPYALNASRE